MHLFVTGASGLVGRAVVRRAVTTGRRVTVLTRNAGKAGTAGSSGAIGTAGTGGPTGPKETGIPSGVDVVIGDPTVAGDWTRHLAGCDAVIHLAGEPIVGRWTRRKRERIRSTRVNGTRVTAEAAVRAGVPVLVSASAVGYYGSFRRNDTAFVEGDLPGSGFLADVCVGWEEAAEPARQAGLRVVHPRLGLVLSADGGALPKMARPFGWYLGGIVGGGRQWMSWIHIDDLAELLLWCATDPRVSGPVNAVAPEPLTHWGFMQLLSAVLAKPCWMSIPSWLVRIGMGAAAELVTHGQRVIPTKADALGFDFRHPLPEPALRHLLRSA